MNSDDWSVLLSVLAILISLASAGIAVLNRRDLRRAERTRDRVTPRRPTSLDDIT